MSISLAAQKIVVSEIHQQPLYARASGAERVKFDDLQTPSSFKRGIYIWMTNYGPKRYMPWYVGKTEQNFSSRISQDDSQLKADEILQEKAWNEKRKTKMHLAFINGDELTSKEIEGLESFLIKDAKRMNPELLNLKKTSDKHKGITHTRVGIVGFQSGELKGVLNRGNTKQKQDGVMLWRTLGHGDQ